MRRLAVSLLVMPFLVVHQLASQGTELSRLIGRLSEGGGYFQSDNLVSNETSYLHVSGALEALQVRGGAYIGVGPEQNFSYIAAIRPEVAFLIDIRRDNMLLHLLFKAMFETARNRLEFLCLLYGRPTPPDLYLWTDLDLGALLNYVDQFSADSILQDRNHRALMRKVAEYGVDFTETDRQTLRRFHDEFATLGLDIRYATRSRRLRLAFPTSRQLYLETDLNGVERSYLSTEDRWRVVRELHISNRIVPVVGDLSGSKAVRAIGEYLRERGQTVSAMYLSNVEQYLFRGGSFGAFVGNVATLPYRQNSLMIRSWFGRGFLLPSSVPGYFSTQIAQTFPQFFRLTSDPTAVDYWMLVNDGLDLRSPAAVPPAVER